MSFFLKIPHQLLILFFLSFSTKLGISNGEKVLFLLPLASKSMANVFEPLMEGLAARGHELKIIAPIKFKLNGFDKSPNVTQLAPIPLDELFRDFPDPFDTRRQSKLFSFPVQFLVKACHKVFANKDFMQTLNEKFDLIIVNIIYNDCFGGIMHKLGSPIIMVSTLPIPTVFTELLGNHQPSSHVPVAVFADVSKPLAFSQRTKNFLYNAYMHIVLHRWTFPYTEAVYKEHLGDDMPSMVQIYKNQVSMIFMNSHFAVTQPRPLLPTVLEIGGIHCEEAKALPHDLRNFVDGAKDGFIVFSLGSIIKASNMPESVRLAFVRTFAKLKQRVVWKWDRDDMPDVPSNVMLVKWLPQQDLLGHPNIKLFITHGGLLSTEEAVYHGVPVLGMPVFIDQDANMKHAENMGFGIKGEIVDLTESKLASQVKIMLEDHRYMQRVKELSKIFRDQPETPLEKAVYWSEYVIRHKGAFHLRSSAMDLNLWQFYSIDVILFLAFATCSTLLFAYFLLKLLYNLIVRGSLMLFPSKRVISKRKRR